MTPRGGNFHVESSASPNVPKDGSLGCVKLNCEDWAVVNAAEYKKLVIFIAMVTATESPVRQKIFILVPTHESA